MTLSQYLPLLKKFPVYLNNAWHDLGNGRGYFGDPSHGEAGIRSMGNVVFTLGLLISLPDNEMGFDERQKKDLYKKAETGIRYLTAGHLTGDLACADGKKWGGVWQSAWWSTRMALGAQLIWRYLSEEIRASIERVVCYEADLQLNRLVPTGLAEDTKAEENAWDAEILAVAISMFPSHPNRKMWWEKFKSFAVNTFSVAADLKNDELCDGEPLHKQVYSVNLHADYTLENHGAYHFCYVASPLHSIAWSTYALMNQNIDLPEALFHHVEEVWKRAKPTFLDRRFAYVSGKDWARYTYGLYFIIPALVLMQEKYRDSDAAAIEQARIDDLTEQHAENNDGSFFGNRFTTGHYYGQHAKYETDCYANVGLAYLLKNMQTNRVPLTSYHQLQKNLRAVHVSQECGIAFSRSEKMFASFSWRTLTSTFPTALIIPIGNEHLAEWQPHNLLGHIVTAEEPEAIGVKGMRVRNNGYEVEGILSYRGKKGQFLYEHHVKFVVDSDSGKVKIRSRFVANNTLRVRRIEGLRFAVANDRFNGFQRTFFSEDGDLPVIFEPKKSRQLQGKKSFLARVVRRLKRELGIQGSQHPISSRWINIDNVLGIVAEKPHAFLLQRFDERNVADGSLHYDLLHCPYQRINRQFKPGEEIIDTEFTLIIGDRTRTKLIADKLK